MTIAAADMQRRDARIAELEERGDARTYLETAELSRLHKLRDSHWRRLPAMLADVRRRAIELEEYGRRWRLPVDRTPA